MIDYNIIYKRFRLYLNIIHIMTDSFKKKSSKVKHLSKITTLDQHHNNCVSQFETNKKELPDKIQLLQSYKNDLLSITEPIGMLQLKDRIQKLEKEIDDIQNNKSEARYFFETSDILFDYYSQIDNTITSKNTEKTNLVSDKLNELNLESQQYRKEKKIAKKRIGKPQLETSVDILSFFKDSDTEKPDSNNIEVTVSNKATLYDNYCKIVNQNYVETKKNMNNLCKNCNKERTLIPAEALFVCTKCGEVEHVIMESEIPNHKDTSTEKSKYPYKRLNHLIECLNQFQAKESIEIPDEVYQQIMNEINRSKQKNKIKDMKYSELQLFMKDILKKINQVKYYEHIPFILTKTTKRHPPTLSREIEEKLKRMFKMIQEPFSRYCPQQRINFLNYSYIFHKFFIILGLDDFADCFPLLRSKDKLYQQDKLWKLICADLDWEYHPSI